MWPSSSADAPLPWYMISRSSESRSLAGASSCCPGCMLAAASADSGSESCAPKSAANAASHVLAVERKSSLTIGSPRAGGRVRTPSG